MGDGRRNLLDRGNTLHSRQQTALPFLSGDDSEMIAASEVCVARFFAMREQYGALTLSERQTPLLISVGLVAGITRMFARRLWARGILDIVSNAPAGGCADERRTAS